MDRERGWGAGETYAVPTAKMAPMPTFLLVAICKFQIATSGMTNMTTSVITLITELAINKAKLSTQLLPATSFLPTHCKVRTRTRAIQ